MQFMIRPVQLRHLLVQETYHRKDDAISRDVTERCVQVQLGDRCHFAMGRKKRKSSVLENHCFFQKYVKTKCYSVLLALHRIVGGCNDSRRNKINAKKHESVVSEILPKWWSQTKVRDDGLKICRHVAH